MVGSDESDDGVSQKREIFGSFGLVRLQGTDEVHVISVKLHEEL